MNFVYYTKLKAETTGFGSSIILRFISTTTAITTGSKLVNLKQGKKIFQRFWNTLQYLPLGLLLTLLLQQNPQDNRQPNGEKGKTLPAALQTAVLGTTQIVPTARKSQLLPTWVYQVRYL